MCATLILLVCGCSEPAVDDAVADVEPSVTASASPVAERTPLPPFNPTPEPSNGTLVTRFDARCELGRVGPEMRLRYGAQIIEGSGAITRVQVLVQGTVAEDSGYISNQIYLREVRFGGSPGRMHKVELRVETRGATQPRTSSVFVHCPREPDGSIV